MSKEHDAPALARREPSISDVDRDAISTAARAWGEALIAAADDLAAYKVKP